ncbi:MAG TPA: carboxypeptidase regulatory-like domain-containing protein [Methanoculleus sp.]|nr:carboxypeptidase regulatory-like domain-containing protein [Methanoculleus sp.]
MDTVIAFIGEYVPARQEGPGRFPGGEAPGGVRTGMKFHLMNLRRCLTMVCVLLLLVSAVQATILDITVEDEDGDAIENAYIYIDGDYEGATDEYGEYEFEHSLDDTFELKVVKSGYDTWKDDIDEDEDSVTVELESSIEEYDLVVYVYDADTLLPISGAEVAIESEYGDTDADDTASSGAVTFVVTEETDYSIEVRDDDYAASSTDVAIEDGDETVLIWLVNEDRVAFRVRDADTHVAIDGAEVFVDGDTQGRTGSGGLLFARFSGTHQVSVVCDGYRTYSKSMTFTGSAVYQLIELTQSISSLTIKVTDSHGNPLSGAAVYIDGDLAGTTGSDGEYSDANMIEGTYTFTVSKDNYEGWEETRTIGETANIYVTLPIIETEVTVIVSDPDHTVVSGAIVTLDGEEIGMTDAAGELAIDLEPGPGYTFDVRKEEYKNGSAVLGVEPGGGSKIVTITLEPEFDVATAGLVILGIVVLAVVIIGGLRLLRRRGGSSGRGGGGL